MKFKSKTEAYSFSLLMLTKINDHLNEGTAVRPEGNPLLKSIDKIKIAIENHEQNLRMIVDILDEAKANLPLVASLRITALQQDLLSHEYQQTPQEKFENPLARRLESELAITLLTQPTQAMMASVKRVSAQLLEFMPVKTIDWQINWSTCFEEEDHVISLGAFKIPPSLPAVKTMLRNNDPSQLAELIHLHFKFAAYFTRRNPIKSAPTRPPVGQLADLIAAAYKVAPMDFFKQLIALDSPKGIEARGFVVRKIYESDLFQAPGNRGRTKTDTFFEHDTNQLGLMLLSQSEEEENLPRHPSSWFADCKNQQPNLDSQYVLDLINNDAVYVSGPSGMCSILLGQMETMVNFEDEDLKKSYLLAIAAYIVGGGFHSLHEVIGPAQYTLNLVPGYHIKAPEIDQLATPPNYAVFFEQQCQIDPEFQTRRDLAWQQYLTYFSEDYGPRHIDGFALEMKDLDSRIRPCSSFRPLSSHSRLSI